MEVCSSPDSFEFSPEPCATTCAFPSLSQLFIDSSCSINIGNFFPCLSNLKNLRLLTFRTFPVEMKYFPNCFKGKVSRTWEVVIYSYRLRNSFKSKTFDNSSFLRRNGIERCIFQFLCKIVIHMKRLPLCYLTTRHDPRGMRIGEWEKAPQLGTS